MINRFKVLTIRLLKGLIPSGNESPRLKSRGIFFSFSRKERFVLALKRAGFSLKDNKTLFVIVLVAFLIRVINIQFPEFTADEVRIAHRGYTLALTGNDELGRKLPWLFNSSEDYQLPLTSYLTALGVSIFGKTDLGARIPFILIGMILVLMVYQIGRRITQKKSVGILAALVAGFSPVLIFLSKIPNETIVLMLLFCMLFYFLTKEKIKIREIIIIILIMLGAVMTSKYSWFILGPFVLFTLTMYQSHLNGKRKILIVAASFLISVLMLLAFLQVPQSKRSLEENNFSLLNDMTIKNGISKLRGQGLESGWPGIFEKALFNKSQFAIIGFIHGISNIQPSIYFGEFDSTGKFGFVGLGAWAKILIIPAGLGIIFLIRRGSREQKLLLLYFLILTWPSMFNYPHFSQELTALTLPFMAILIALGFGLLNKKITTLIAIIMVFEIIINLSYLSFQEKSTNEIRPVWIKSFVLNMTNSTDKNQLAVSDDINMDIIPYVAWYSLMDPKKGFVNIDWAYRYRQTRLDNLTTIGADDSFYKCDQNKQLSIFVSERDLGEAEDTGHRGIKTSFKDSLGKNKVYLLSDGVCVR